MTFIRTAAAAALLTAIASPASAQQYQYQQYQYQPTTPTPYQQYQYQPITPTPYQQYQYQPTTPTPYQQYQYQPTTPTPYQQYQYQPTTPTPYQPYQPTTPSVEEDSPERMVRRLVRGKWVFHSAPRRGGALITGLEGEVDIDLENGVQGKSPCNDFISSITLAPQDRRTGSLDFYNIQRTVTPCDNPRQENNFLSRLDRADRYAIVGTRRDGGISLVLYEGQRELMTLRRPERRNQQPQVQPQYQPYNSGTPYYYPR